MAFNLNNIVSTFLKDNSPEAFTTREIAQWIWKNYPDECTDKIKRTKLQNSEELIIQLSAEIGSHYEQIAKRNIGRTSDRPRKYYYENPEKNIEEEECKTTKRKNNQPEHALYPLLAQYCKTLGINTLRIDEKTSLKNKGKNYNVWLHPDIVGFEDLTKEFNEDLTQCVIEHGAERSCFYSFEVKDGIIPASELRKNFFQTVSNSSWANYSYLVAEGLGGDLVEKELQLLCASFKIGFIQLDKKDINNSKIIIQAPKTELDWNMINRIAKENPDFRKYIKNITLSYKGASNKYAAKPEWDINE